MPTIIDALVLELGFDTRGMEQGRRQVVDVFNKTQDGAKKTGSSIDEANKKASESIGKLRANVLSLYAAFTAGKGLKEFISDMTSSDAALGRFAQTVNESAQTIATWRGAANLMGISNQAVDSTFSSLTSQLEQFRLTGDGAIASWLRIANVSPASVFDANGVAHADQLILQLADHFKDFKDKAEATQILLNIGVPAEFIPLVLKGRAAVQGLLDKNKEFGAAQAADVAAAQQRQQAWAEFIHSATTVGTLLLTTLTPALIGLTHAAQAFSDWGEHHPGLVGDAFAALTAVVGLLTVGITVGLVGTAITSAIAGFGTLFGLASKLSLFLATLTETVLPALSEAFLTLGIAIEATPIGWIITGIAALAAAGYALYKNWDDIAAWWSKLWGGMGDDAEKGADKATSALDRLNGGKGGPRDAQAQSDIAKFQAMGWTREQAIGIVANTIGESSGRLGAVGDNGTAFGLAQWHPDRQANFAAWAGHDIRSATRDEQLGFINYELRQGGEVRAGRALAAAGSYADATRAFTQYDERPGGDVNAKINQRVAIAAQLARLPSNPAAAAVYAATARPSSYQTGTFGAPEVAQAAPSNALSNVTHNNSSSSDTRINTLVVNSAAKDAGGIASDIRGSLQRDATVQQANQGPV